MKKALALLTLLFASAIAHAQSSLVNYFGDCSSGAGQAITQGLQSSNFLRTNYPQCTVTVYAHGTQNKETIYADSNSTPLTNPFTANSNALYGFYMAPGQLIDIVMSSSAFVTMPTTTISGIVSGEIALAGVQSINTVPGAFTFNGPGVSCTGTTCTFTGSGSTTLQNDLVAKGASGLFQDEYNFYADANFTAQQAYTAAAANNGTFTITPTAGRKPFAATGNIRATDLRADVPATAIGVTEKGAVCDGSLQIGELTQGSNTWTIENGTLTTADVGKVIAAVGSVSGLQTAFESVITAVPDSLHATLTSNAPFTRGFQRDTYGHDDTTGIRNALNESGTIVFPEGICLTHTQLLAGQSPIGIGPGSAVLNFPGEDTFVGQDPATAHNGGQGPAHIHDLTFYFNQQLDPTLPWQICNDSGCTSQTPFYRPVAIQSAVTSNPTAPAWMQGSGPNNGGAFAGAGAINSGTPTHLTVASAQFPANGTKLVFPYLSSVFTTTVASGGGTANIVMANSYPGATNSQAEFISGTSQQTIAASISSGSCPSLISLTNSILPSPASEVNIAPYGLIQIDGEQFSYFGKVNAGFGLQTWSGGQTYGVNAIVFLGGVTYQSLQGNNTNHNPATATTFWQVIPSAWQLFNIGCAQNGTSRAAHSVGATVVPLNQFKPSAPWPVTPTLNSGNTTPANTAAYYPGWNVGNAAFAFPNTNGSADNGNDGSWSEAVINNLSFINWPNDATSQAVNHGAMFYFAQPAYATHFNSIYGLYMFYGVAEGGPSIQTGNWANGQPTADGSHWDGVTIFAANPWLKAYGNQNSFSNINVYSSEGQTGGADTCFYNTGIWNDQTGGVASAMSLDHFKNIYCEPENGTHTGSMPNWEWDTFNSEILDLHMGGGGEVYVGGNFQHWIGGNANQTSIEPWVTWGAGNTSEYTTLLGNGNVGNTYGVNALINYGPLSNYMGQTDQAFSNGSGPYGALQAGNGQMPFPSQTAETFQTGNLTVPYVSGAASVLNPVEYNTSFSFENEPMNVGWTFDDTAPVTHSYAACNVGNSGGSNYCFSDRFNEDNIAIGPGQRIVAGKYEVYAAFKDVTAATNAFNLIIGTATGCSQAQIIQKNVAITNQWPSTEAAMDMGEIDFTGAQGCTLAVVYAGASTADQIQKSFIAFAPVQENIVAQNINATSINLLGGAGCNASPVTGLGKGFVCPANGFVGTVTSNQGATDTTLTITTTSTVSPVGCASVDGEVECWSSLSGNVASGVTRGQYQSTAVSHSAGAPIFGYSLILGSPSQPRSFSVAFGQNEQQVVGINNPTAPFDHGGAAVLTINQPGSENETWVNTNGGIYQTAPFTTNFFGSPMSIGETFTIKPIITDSGYLMQSNLAQTDYLPLGVGGGIAGSLSVIQPPTIAASTVQSSIPSGGTTVSYVCSGTDFDGNLVPGTTVSLTNVASSWSFPASAGITCPWSAGVNTYQIYRTAGGTNQGLVASGVGPGFSFLDFDGAASAGTPPTTNTTVPQLRAWNLSLAGPGVPVGTCLQTGVNGAIVPVSPAVACGTGGGGGGMVYPGVGVAVSAGGSWASSLAFGTGNNALLQLNNSGQIPAVNGSLVVALSAANITTGGVANIEIAGEEDVTFTSNPSFSIATRYSTIALTGNISTFTLPSGQPGQEKTLTFCQVSPGGFTVGAPTNVLGFSGIVPTTAACTSFHLTYKSTSTAWLVDAAPTTASATAAPAPTIAAGTGAGTSPTVAVVAGANSDSGFFSVTTGTSPTAAATVATITFGVPYSAAPRCSVWAANAATQALVGTASAAVYPSGTSGTAFALVQGPTGLAAATPYEWGYKCNSSTAGFTGGGSSGGGTVYPAGNGIAVVTGGSAWGTTLAAPTSAIVGINDVQTLTNKVIASSEITGLPTFPSGAIVGSTDTQTLTNKTITSPSISTTNLQLTSQGASNVWHLVQAPTNVTAQTANIGNTTVYTPTGGNGWYKVCVNESVTRAATTSSTLPAVQFFYTAVNDSTVKNIFLGGSTQNNTGIAVSQCSGPLFATNAILVYDTTGYASSGATTMQYDVQIEIETF